MGLSIVGTRKRAEEVVAEIRSNSVTALQAHGASVESTAKAKWVGWKNPTGTSLAAWRTGTVEEIGSTLRVIVGNDAETKRGKPYTEYVHRSGVVTPEVQRLEADTFPALVATLHKELEAGAHVSLTL